MSGTPPASNFISATPLVSSTASDWALTANNARLSASSNLVGAGQNGEDLGVFGGQSPFIVSGLPELPVITKFIAPTSISGSRLNFQLEVKARP